MRRVNTSWYSEVPDETDTRSDFDKWIEGDLDYRELTARDKKFADRIIGKAKKSVEQLSRELKDILDSLKKLEKGEQ